MQQPISPELARVLDKLLQLEVNDRYQTASAVLVDLTPHLQAIPQTTRGPIPNSSSYQSASPSPISPSPSPSISTNYKINRRQFLTWVAFGGVGLGSVLAWELIKNRSKSPESVTERGLAPSGSSSPSPEPSPELSFKSFNFEVVSVDVQGEITNRRQKQAQFFVEDLGNGTTLDMVSIPGGRFIMGSPESELRREDDESPQHQVTVPEFYIGKYPVTQAQWQEIMGANPSNFKGANRPVKQISWEEAIEFCQELSQKTGKDYRLPSEAEWEYACRSGTSTPFYLGETITPKLANYDGTSTYGSGPKGEYRKQTTDVGSFPANAFGLYDMHGNVWEWCQDNWHDSYSGAPIDGSAWVDNESRYRILRSGSYNCNPKCCRASSRNKHLPHISHDSDGFRVALQQV